MYVCKKVICHTAISWVIIFEACDCSLGLLYVCMHIYMYEKFMQICNVMCVYMYVMCSYIRIRIHTYVPICQGGGASPFHAAASAYLGCACTSPPSAHLFPTCVAMVSSNRRVLAGIVLSFRLMLLVGLLCLSARREWHPACFSPLLEVACEEKKSSMCPGSSLIFSQTLFDLSL